MHRAAVVVAALAVSAGVITACSSGGSKSQSSVTPAAPATSSAAPMTSVPPTTTAPTTVAPSTPAATPTSQYEADPAMKVLRLWASESAKAVNSRNFKSPALTKLEYSAYVSIADSGYQDDLKARLRYPGPLPFTPVSRTNYSATRIDYNVCVISQGFAVDPKTGQPASAITLRAEVAQMIVQDGTWRIGGLIDAKPAFSCAGVNVVEEKF